MIFRFNDFLVIFQHFQNFYIFRKFNIFSIFNWFSGNFSWLDIWNFSTWTLRVRFGYNCIVGLEWSKTENYFQKFGFFCRVLAPAQRAAGGCSPLKVTPGRGLAARRNFFTKLVKINDFEVEIIVFMWIFMSFVMSKFSEILFFL